MRKVWVLAGCLLSWWPALADPLPAPTTRVEVGALQPTDAALVEAFADGVVGYAMRDDRIAGASVAVVQDGRVLVAKGYGTARLSPFAAAGRDTLFRTGSISKTAVYLAAMQLIEQGKLAIDDPVNERLPEALRIPDDGFAEPIRIHDLFNHTAGFEDSFAGHLFRRSAEDAWPLETWLERFRPKRVAPPGSRAAYSNYGVALLGRIVAGVSGKPWETVAEERILRPLGMTTATFREPYAAETAAARGLPAPPAPDSAARFADGFFWTAGRFEPAPFELVVSAAPAGALSASAADMASYMIALLDPARMEAAGVLKASTLEAMREPSFRNAEGVGAIRNGFYNYAFPGAPLAFGHGGDTLRFHADMVLLPELKLGIYISTNTASGVPLRNRFARTLIAEFFPQAALDDARPAQAASDAARVAGTYLGWRRPHERSEAFLGLFAATIGVTALPDGDILIAAGPGGDAVRYAPIGDLRYRAVDSAAVVAFRETQDRTMQFVSALNGADRAGGLAVANTLLAMLGAAVLFAGLWLARSAAHAVRKTPSSPRERLADAATAMASLLWIGAAVLLGVALARLVPNDAQETLFAYPGWDYAGACWLFLAAALATAAATAAGAWSWTGARRWRRTRRALQALTLAAFLAGAIAAWAAGLLGYTGFAGA